MTEYSINIIKRVKKKTQKTLAKLRRACRKTRASDIWTQNFDIIFQTIKLQETLSHETESLDPGY